MTHANSDLEVEALDLLAERAISGLDADMEARLDAILATCDTVEDDKSIDQVVAQLDVSWASSSMMPSSLRSKIAAVGHCVAASETKASSDVLRLMPWGIAAAASILTMVLFMGSNESSPVRPEAARRALIATAADLVQPAWTKSEYAGYENVTGNVIWSGDRQEGYMLLRGLPLNEHEQQYQLWIVAGGQKHPVDGGVFEVRETGELVVPIDAKLDIRNAKAFALTLERRGGVVVSDGPLLVVAPI